LRHTVITYTFAKVWENAEFAQLGRDLHEAVEVIGFSASCALQHLCRVAVDLQTPCATPITLDCRVNGVVLSALH
jgi:hypothetical protein